MEKRQEPTQGSLLKTEFYYPATDSNSFPVEEYAVAPDGQYETHLSQEVEEKETAYDEGVVLLEAAIVRNIGQARKRRGFVSESPEAVRAQHQSAAERGISRQLAIGQAAVNANEFEARARQLYEEWFELKSAEIPEEVDPRDYVPTFAELEDKYFDEDNSKNIRAKLYQKAEEIKLRNKPTS